MAWSAFTMSLHTLTASLIVVFVAQPRTANYICRESINHHDCSVLECISDCPLHGPGLIPGHDEVFQGIFPWLIALCRPIPSQFWEKMAQSPLDGATQPVGIQEEGLHSTMDGQLVTKERVYKLRTIIRLLISGVVISVSEDSEDINMSLLTRDLPRDTHIDLVSM